jgi:hypothetical protein
MKKHYEVIGKDENDDWETIREPIITLKEAIKIAKKQNIKVYKTIDINLIIDDDLTETYDENGKIR